VVIPLSRSFSRRFRPTHHTKVFVCETITPEVPVVSGKSILLEGVTKRYTGQKSPTSTASPETAAGERSPRSSALGMRQDDDA
jgi:hypothetical protein